MAEFTPGPWEMMLPMEEDKFVVVGTRQQGVALVGGSSLGEKLANAHLIACAPEMFEALGEVTLALEMFHPMNSEEPCATYEIWDKAKRTLAKAKGEARE